MISRECRSAERERQNSVVYQLRLLYEERGQTLTEELVALAIFAFAVSIVLLTIFTGTVGVKTKHDRVNASILAKSQLELITDAPYSADPTAVPYVSVLPVTGYTVDVSVEYWIAPDGPFTTTIRNDALQKVTVSVTGDEGIILQLERYKVDR